MSTKASVLIVDDDPHIRKTLFDILKTKGYATVGAAKGKTALVEVEKEKPAIVLIDLKLPDMDGLEVMGEIKERSPGTECIVITGHASQSSAIKAINLGAYGYVQKPYDVEQLLVTIRRAVEKREAEEALRESEEKYRTLVEQSLQGLVVVQDFRIVFANTAFADISGYTIEELLSLSPEEVRAMIHPEDQALVWGRFRDRLAGKPVPPRYEYRGIRKDGTVRWLEMVASRVEYRGKPAIQGVIVDITERKRAEEALRQRTEQLETLRQVGLELTTELNPDVLLHSIVSRAVEMVGGDSGSLYLYRPEQNDLEWAIAIGPDVTPNGSLLRRGEGLSGKVWETGEPLIVDDYQRWEGRAVFFGSYSFTAIVGVPVRWGEEFLGVLTVLAEEPGAFSPTDAELLGLFATQAAIAIANARLFEAEQERRHIAETLRQASTVLNSTLELDEVLGLILQQLHQVIPYDSASVQRLQGERLEIVAGQGFEEPDKIVGLLFQLDPKFPNYRVVTTKAPLAVEDVSQDYPHFKDEADSYESAHIRSWLGVPLMVKDQVIGMIALDRAEVRPYTAEESELAMAFANQAAIAIENARLYQAVQRELVERKRAEQLLQALNEAALAMERALTPEEIFAAVAKEFEKIGLSCMVLPTDESQSRLFITYLNLEATLVKAAEKLMGFKREGFSFPIENVDIYREVVWERKAVFTKNTEEVMRQVLPGPAKRFAGRIVRMVNYQTVIAAPLIVEDKVIGVLSVQSDDLIEDDVAAITAFAHQIAAAWRKAQLMRDLEKSLEELKQTQAQLLQAQKMEAIGQLAGGIAHDFNNMLTSIGGFTELLLWKAPKGSQQHEDLRQIKVATERAAALTRQLLLFTRQKEGERLPTQLNSVVEETHDLLTRSIPKEIAIELRLESGLWAVEADPSQMSQVLMNLCVNARDAMPAGGTLTLETRNVTLDEEQAQAILAAQPGRYVRLSIADTGCGMSPEVQDRLFEPFFTTKEVGKGTGLGLAVVYGIVRGHGGFINVYSEVGQGSTFRIYLPAIELAVEEQEAETLELPTGTETILLVDDEKAVWKLGQRILKRCGYTVLKAENGVQALEVYQAHQGEIALVVLDMVMPKMGGQECLRRLRELDPQAKVLISTGYTTDGSAQELVAKGALGMVEKPFLLRDFAAAVRTALDES